MNAARSAGVMLIGLCLLMMSTVGVLVYGGTVLTTNMALSLNLDRTALGTVAGINSLAIGLFAPIAGQAVFKWGARAAMLCGILLLVLGCLALATVIDSLVGLVVVYGVVIAIGVSLGTTVPSFTVASYWFSKRVAFAITSIGIATNLGGSIAAPFLTRVISGPSGSWRTGWLVAAGASAFAFLLAFFLIRDRPEDTKGEGTAPGKATGGPSGTTGVARRRLSFSVYRTSVELEFRDAMRRGAVYWMLAGVVIGSCAMGIIMVHGVAHLMDLGNPASAAASFISAVLGAGIVANIIYALIGDHVEPRYVFGLALLLIGLGMAQMGDPGRGLGLWPVATLMGMGFALPIRCLSTMFVNYFGRASFSRYMGVVLFGMAVGPAATVIGAGAVFDAFGSYTPVMYPLAGICVFLAIAMPFVRPPAVSAGEATAGGGQLT